MRGTRFLLAVCACLPFAAVRAADPPAKTEPERLKLWNGSAPVGDGKSETAEAWITVHKPEKPNGAAAVICPGGGYGGLVTGAEGHGIAAWLNRHGITGVVLEYRLPKGRPFVPLLDAQRAIRTVRANAKTWGIDPAKVGIIGFSAGGHLASTAGTHFDDGDPRAETAVEKQSCRPDFMILVYPVITMSEKTHGGSRTNLLGQKPDEKLVKLFSNETQVTAKTPPAFLAHAKDDRVVLPENSQAFSDALTAQKVPAKYLELPSGGHGLNGYKGPMWDAWQAQSLAWLAEMKFIPADAAGPPESTPKPVTDTYHGVTVTDPYRWLEDGADKAVQKWSDAQNAHARSVLDKLPGVESIREQLTKIMAAKTTSHGSFTVRGAAVFAMRRQPPKQQPFLVVMPAADKPDDARVLVDPGELDKKGTTTIDWYVPSWDGKLVAVSLSKAGSESGDVQVFDVETGKPVGAVVPRVNGGTAGGDLVWAPDDKGFYYTRYPREGERPAADLDFFQQVYFHALGTPTAKDRYELGKDLPRVAEIKLELDRATGLVLATVQNGDSGEFAHYVRSTDGTWKAFAGFKDGAVQAVFGPKGELFVVSRKDAPRGKVLRLSAVGPDLAKAEVVIPAGEDTIVTDFYGSTSRQTVLPTATRLYVTYQLGGPSAFRCFALDGKPLPAPKQPEVGTVRGLTPAGGDDVLFTAGSFTLPSAAYLYKAKGDETVKLPLTSPPVVDLSDITVVRDFATSKDGTKVPVNILTPKGAKRDGSNPCLVTGYGGYGLNTMPTFRPEWRVLFDHGFVVAVVNLRGGGEYGEDWHRAGMLTKKQNVFDDFVAALTHLIERKYTTPEKLAIEGGSNGGLLMGATMTQHPELMKCVVSHVGIYDMLRVELSPNGAFNIPEFGTVKEPDQFKALRAYSPYHNVKDGTKYPAVLLLTGANDPRVDPMQSRKFTARLQAANPGGVVLLRTSASSGHGLGTALSERIEEATDVDAFLFAQLGVTAKR